MRTSGGAALTVPGTAPTAIGAAAGGGAGRRVCANEKVGGGWKAIGGAEGTPAVAAVGGAQCIAVAVHMAGATWVPSSAALAAAAAAAALAAALLAASACVR